MISSNKSDFTINFGLKPVSNRFLSNKNEKAPRFPLGLSINKDTGLVSIDQPFPVAEVKPRFDWITCFEPEDHLNNLVEKLINLPGIDKNSSVGAYSFKDDSTIDRLNNKGYQNTWRIDPEYDLCVDKFSNIETYQQEFTIKKSIEIKNKYGPADILLVRHVVEHAYNIYKFIDAIRLLIKPNGYIVWELPSCEKALKSGDCTMIWEEHIYYFTEFTFKQFLINQKFYINSLSTITYPMEDCIVAITQELVNKKTYTTPNKEDIYVEIERAKKYIEIIQKNMIVIPNKLSNIRKKYGKIAIFGGGHASVAFISILGIENLIDFIIDDNPNKISKKLPAGNIPIIDSSALYKQDIKICLLGTNPQSHYKIIDKHKDYVNIGGVFASIFPGTEIYFDDVL
jgi:hypothetical protein